MAFKPRKISRKNADNERIFDRSYELLDVIGRGQHSTVYKARKIYSSKSSKDELLAIKVILPGTFGSEDPGRRLQREAVAMLSSRHENVIRLHNFASTSEVSYMSMEYAENGDLRKQLEARSNPFDPSAAISLIIQVLNGLQAIHHAGIIHRDIKPENLLLSSDGTVKIADFGIALIPTENKDVKNNPVCPGTMEYMAPETLEKGFSGISTDIYGVGVCLYQLLTKHTPFEDPSPAKSLNRTMQGKRTPLSHYVENVPDGLEELLDCVLHQSYSRRFRSAVDFRRSLQMFLAGTWDKQAIDGALDDKIVLFSSNTDDQSVVSGGLRGVGHSFQDKRTVTSDLKELMPHPLEDRKSSNPFPWSALIFSVLIICAVMYFSYGHVTSQLNSGVSANETSDAQLGESKAEDNITEIIPNKVQETPAIRETVSSLPLGKIFTKKRIGIIKGLYFPGDQYQFEIYRDPKTKLIRLNFDYPGSTTYILKNPEDSAHDVAIFTGPNGELRFTNNNQYYDFSSNLQGTVYDTKTAHEAKWSIKAISASTVP